MYSIFTKKKVLKFGKFVLKSGRISPYFFDIGTLNQGVDLYLLGKFYAQFLIKSKSKFDILFGPSYKGIPIVVSTVINLARTYNINVNYCFNRKERKIYGEKSVLIGHKKLRGKVILIDDVITTGSTIEEIANIIRSHKEAKLSGIIVALDRQEKTFNHISSIENIEKKYKCKVIPIINFSDLIQYLKKNEYVKYKLFNIEKYRIQYGIQEE